ncbi:hypothetical protein [Pandoraea sp. ISTKB]|uniref:hypothetical protein n=1 Tax=Pandoraea sp. ISTKB TaxID=1586708 RepID=UPI00084670A5|nr:hypothetical protein [Pandoraea sp. ISTKB]ODP32612.1 hypothetical protein A9762_22265 [Pandoraea sp. ISTKB]
MRAKAAGQTVSRRRRGQDVTDGADGADVADGADEVHEADECVRDAGAARAARNVPGNDAALRFRMTWGGEACGAP